jgi:hypothetical protein
MVLRAIFGLKAQELAQDLKNHMYRYNARFIIHF